LYLTNINFGLMPPGASTCALVRLPVPCARAVQLGQKLDMNESVRRRRATNESLRRAIRA